MRIVERGIEALRETLRDVALVGLGGFLQDGGLGLPLLAVIIFAATGATAFTVTLPAAKVSAAAPQAVAVRNSARKLAVLGVLIAVCTPRYSRCVPHW